MPGKDGTGPFRQAGRERPWKGRRGRSEKVGCGPSGECLCPSCGRTMAHQPGVPCSSMMCPWCGSEMIRA